MKSRMSNEVVTVEVAYAMPGKQLILPVKAFTGITAKEAIQLSGVLDAFPEIDLLANKIGIFGKILSPVDRRPKKSTPRACFQRD
jgi:uncharacterized protein